MGMGNVSVTFVTDRTSIFYNPAGLSLLKNVVELSISPIILSVDGKFITLLKAVKDHKSKLTDISEIDEDFIEMLNEMDGQWVGFKYLPEIVFVTDNLGFGIYSTLPVNVRVESGHFIPKLALRGVRDVVFTWAVGIPLRNFSNHCGISVEYIQRIPLNETITTYSETFIYFDKVASNKALKVLGDLSEIEHGVSFDVSFLHDFIKFQGFRLSYSLKDVLGVVGGKIVFPPNLTVGCAYNFPQMNEVKLIDNLILAFEISNIFGLELESEKYEHFGKKLHLGLELDLHYGIFRMGINQGYFTTGLGVRYGLFFMDYAFSTEEMGYYPGQLPNKKHVLSMGAGIRFKKRIKKNETGNQDINSSGSSVNQSDDKQQLKPLNSDNKSLDINQNGPENITVEKPPLKKENQGGNSMEEIQDSYEGVTGIDNNEAEKGELESGEAEKGELENGEAEKGELESGEAEKGEVKNGEVKDNQTEEEKIGWE
jgi:hypothetical protein